VRCFAMAIPDSPAPLAISVSGPISRVDQSFADRAVPAAQRRGRPHLRRDAERPLTLAAVLRSGQESPPAVPEVPALTSPRR
jgi:hypothetical protein